MTRDYIVKHVLFRYTIRASVTALAVRGDEWDGHNRVLKSKFLSETGVFKAWHKHSQSDCTWFLSDC